MQECRSVQSLALVILIEQVLAILAPISFVAGHRLIQTTKLIFPMFQSDFLFKFSGPAFCTVFGNKGRGVYDVCGDVYFLVPLATVLLSVQVQDNIVQQTFRY